MLIQVDLSLPFHLRVLDHPRLLDQDQSEIRDAIYPSVDLAQIASAFQEH